MPARKTRSPKKSPPKRVTPKRKTPKRKTPKRGGAFNADLQALAVPFALAVMQRGVASQKKSKRGGAPEDGMPPADFSGLEGGARKKKASKAKVAEIKKEFLNITESISNFLAKY